MNMKKIILVSCVSEKLLKKAIEEDLYISPLFNYSLAYAKLLKPDKILILSSTYGFVD